MHSHVFVHIVKNVGGLLLAQTAIRAQLVTNAAYAVGTTCMLRKKHSLPSDASGNLSGDTAKIEKGNSNGKV